MLSKMSRRAQKLYVWFTTEQVGGQTIEWIALGMLILGIMGAVVAGLQTDDGTLGEKMMLALGRMVDRIGN